MKYPCLILESACKSTVKVTIYEERISRTGGPIVVMEDVPLKCNYQDSSKVILTKGKKEVVITGTALFRGDICPECEEISSGKVDVFGMTRDIARGTKARNPDGTVNYTKLELM